MPDKRDLLVEFGINEDQVLALGDQIFKLFGDYKITRFAGILTLQNTLANAVAVFMKDATNEAEKEKDQDLIHQTRHLVLLSISGLNEAILDIIYKGR